MNASATVRADRGYAGTCLFVDRSKTDVVRDKAVSAVRVLYLS